MEHYISDGSNCSLWGSVFSHVNSRGERYDEDKLSEAGSHVTIDVDVRTASMVGSKRVVCQTEAESMANKLNRTEQCKLENYKIQVHREKLLQQKLYRQTESIFRAKCAKMFDQQRNGTLKQQTSGGRDRLLRQRPMSSPSKIRQKKSDSVQTECAMCRQIQEIIQTFEFEGMQTGVVEPVTGHSTCLFSDRQVRTFIHILETKYLNDLPNFSQRLKGINQPLQYANAANAPPNPRDNSVQARIRRFCVNVDKFNKEKEAIPEEIKHSMDHVRLANAVHIKEIPTPQQTLQMEIKALLKLPL